MKFPGKRKSKHYFPVSARDPLIQTTQQEQGEGSTIVGIDQIMVDIEARVDESLLQRYQLSAGHSLVIDDARAEALDQEMRQHQLSSHQVAGGTIGKTLHN